MDSIEKINLEHLPGQEVGSVSILKELARGGAAVVFIAFQRTLKRRIALKILPKSLLTPETAERFQREAEAAAILSHPNIIQIYDVGETEEFLFFAMQLISGRSVKDYIKAAQKHVLPSRRMLPVKATVDIAIKVLDALEYAHNQNIIHRDIKPANVLIETHTKRPIVVDFGIAKVSEGLDRQSSVIQGTPLYMPPEQILNKKSDGQADIYATGVMLFEMLVSNLPLPHWKTTLELLQMKLNLKDKLFQKRPSQLNKTVNPDMDDIVLKAVSYEPEMRYATCREFLEQLEEYRENHLRKKL